MFLVPVLLKRIITNFKKILLNESIIISTTTIIIAIFTLNDMTVFI